MSTPGLTAWRRNRIELRSTCSKVFSAAMQSNWFYSCTAGTPGGRGHVQFHRIGPTGEGSNPANPGTREQIQAPKRTKQQPKEAQAPAKAEDPTSRIHGASRDRTAREAGPSSRRIRQPSKISTLLGQKQFQARAPKGPNNQSQENHIQTPKDPNQRQIRLLRTECQIWEATFITPRT
jgi:hypothetical protein